MSRPQKTVRLWKNKQTGVFYYRLPGGAWRSTGCKSRPAAHNFAMEKYKADEVAAAKKRPRRGTVKDLLQPYYLWDEDPRIGARRLEGKQIARQHAEHSRRLLELHVWGDPIAELLVRGLTVGAVEDFRARLAAKVGPRTVNGVLTALGAVFAYLHRRGELPANPFAAVGKLSYQKREAGVFTATEIAALFPEDGLGPWEDQQAYTCFLIAATCGLRRGELLALARKHVDFEAKALHVLQAWQDAETLGPPKRNQKRDVPLPDTTLQALKELRAASFHVLPDSLLFCDGQGHRRGATWYQGHFTRAMATAGIDSQGRRLTAHSFRHSANTLLLDSGADPAKVRQALGWTNPGTQEQYTHHSIESLRTMAAIIDGVFGAKK